jgi:hypothetical protein
MAVMTAGVHSSGALRTVVKSVGLFHQQSIHIGAKPNGSIAAGRLMATADNADNTGAGDTAVHLNAPLNQPGSDYCTRAVFFESDLWVCVKVPAPSGHF